VGPVSETERLGMGGERSAGECGMSSSVRGDGDEASVLVVLALLSRASVEISGMDSDRGGRELGGSEGDDGSAGSG